MKKESKKRLQMCQTNSVLDLAKKAFPKDAGSSIYTLQQLAADANDKQLAGIPAKYWKAVRSLPNVCKELCLIYCLHMLILL
jgi:hypothetical protein